MANDSNSSTGVSFMGLLGIVFIVLKLTGHITWSWWLITLPFWGGLVLVLTILLIVFIVKSIL